MAAVAIGAAVFVSWFLFGRNLNDDVRRMIQTMAGLTSYRVTIESSGSPKAALLAEYRFDTEGQYTYLQHLPADQQIDLTPFLGEWIFLPKTLSLLPLLGQRLPYELTADERAALLQLLKKIDLVDAKATGVVEIIGAEAVLPYRFVVNQEGLAVLLAAWWKIQHGEEIDAARFQALTSQVATLADLEGTLFIGRESFLLHRLTLKSTELKLRLDLSGFNLPAEVSNGQEMRKVLSDLGFNVAALPVAENAKVSKVRTSASTNAVDDTATDDDPDDDGLDNTEELFYGTDANHPDSDGDGVSDGEEVANGQNPKGDGGLFSFGLPF